jgi:DNA-binding response OmpR family regulator
VSMVKSDWRMKASILWIEGKRADSPSFVPSLRRKDYQVEVVNTGNAALGRINDLEPDMLVINAASLRSSGTRICHSVRNMLDGLPIILILAAGQVVSSDVPANVILNLPFTVRKLVNRIAPFIPGEGSDILRAGVIHLDLVRKQVRCPNKEAKLTPRLTRLLQILMENHGEVVAREALFRKAWNTEYTGDTRTLDVHISWLRKALEDDVRNPRYLKTIRRVGYRLDV